MDSLKLRLLSLSYIGRNGHQRVGSNIIEKRTAKKMESNKYLWNSGRATLEETNSMGFVAVEKQLLAGYYRSLVLSSPIPPFKYVTFLTPFFPSRWQAHGFFYFTFCKLSGTDDSNISCVGEQADTTRQVRSGYRRHIDSGLERYCLGENLRCVGVDTDIK